MYYSKRQGLRESSNNPVQAGARKEGVAFIVRPEVGGKMCTHSHFILQHDVCRDVQQCVCGGNVPNGLLSVMLYSRCGQKRTHEKSNCTAVCW